MNVASAPRPRTKPGAPRPLSAEGAAEAGAPASEGSPEGPPLDPTAGQSPEAPQHEPAEGEPGADGLHTESLETRASGRPDHPRTLKEIVASGYIRVLT